MVIIRLTFYKINFDLFANPAYSGYDLDSTERREEMKIEKIDDNSIRCTLTSLDLSSRNLNLRDMTYGSKGAKMLFQEMMQKAQDEVGFSSDNTPLMIEAIPLQGGAIQLIISKIDDPEELDTRFSKFSQNITPQQGFLSQLVSQILEGAQEMMKTSDKNTEAENTEQQEERGSENTGETEDHIRIFRFYDLDQLIAASQAVASVYHGDNVLYKDSRKNRFYLCLMQENDRESLLRAANILAEYGDKIIGDETNIAYFREHFECMIPEKAVQKLSKI